MKELYTAPEAKLLCFVAEERLATSVNFDDLLAGGNGGIPVTPSKDDLPLDF